MLEHLEIDQFALIEHAALDLDDGFQVITGETGAGKSLLLGALGAITGAGINKDLIRQGAESALVEAVFTDVRASLQDDPDLADFCKEEDQVILSREIKASGRTLCKINGRLVPLQMMRRMGDHLVDIHGQNDRQQIFQADKHLSILDRYGKKDIQSARQNYSRAFQAYQELLKQVREWTAEPEERTLLLERLKYQIAEIEAVLPTVGEDEQLQEKRNLLIHQEKMRQGLGQVLYSLEGDGRESGAGEQVAKACNELQKLAGISSVLDQPFQQMLEIQDLLRDVLGQISSLVDLTESRQGDLEQIDERLDKITRLKRKYGGSIESVLAYLDKAKTKLLNLEEAEVLVNKLQEKKIQLQGVLEERGLALRQARQKAAENLSAEIGKELQDLGMTDARFEVAFQELSVRDARSYGLENVEFLLAANRGEGLKPLAKTASGGEASRIMLAIKVILAEADEIPVLVFDEIDTGISGETTRIVGQKLKRLADSHQILCVSHQAQIAASANGHFYIYKEHDEERTKTQIRLLTADERTAEIARLLSGDARDPHTLKLAAQMLGNQAEGRDRSV